MTRIRILLLVLLLALLPIIAAIRVNALEDNTNHGLKISEIKLGGGSDPKEFVELFNDSSEAIDLTEWSLEYAKTTFAKTACSAPSWKSVANPASSVTAKILTGSISAYSFTVVEMSLTDNTAGSLQLVSSDKQHDLVGWGELAPCYFVSPASIPLSGQVVKRTFGADGRIIVSQQNNNANDFHTEAIPSPGSDPCLISDCYTEPEPAPDIVHKEAIITELLPNPESPKLDSEEEFIELFNPHGEPLNLEGYKLSAASQSSTYQAVLKDMILQPGEFKALYSKETKLSLVNTKPGYVWLTAPDGTVLYETEWYPETIAEEQAWALDGEIWKLTDTPTPGSPNQILLSEGSTDPGGCPTGKYLNPGTGRCKLLPVLTGIKPCKPGQVRNPDTNRCRNAATAKTTAACKPGQVRNLETGRCRKAAVSASSACKQGYERNKETNRCRKVSAAAVKGDSTDGGSSANKLNTLIITVSSAALLAYAGYEYRQDLLNRLLRIKAQLKSKKEEVIQ